MDINEILCMLSWVQNEETQLQGIIEAKKVRQISMFFQPTGNRAVWENCATVIASKTNAELQMYTMQMFEWLKDMNWPGAEIIFDRLLQMPASMTDNELSFCLDLARRTDDEPWAKSLLAFQVAQDQSG